MLLLLAWSALAIIHGFCLGTFHAFICVCQWHFGMLPCVLSFSIFITSCFVGLLVCSLLLWCWLQQLSGWSCNFACGSFHSPWEILCMSLQTEIVWCWSSISQQRASYFVFKCTCLAVVVTAYVMDALLFLAGDIYWTWLKHPSSLVSCGSHGLMMRCLSCSVFCGRHGSNVGLKCECPAVMFAVGIHGSYQWSTLISCSHHGLEFRRRWCDFSCWAMSWRQQLLLVQWACAHSFWYILALDIEAHTCRCPAMVWCCAA